MPDKARARSLRKRPTWAEKLMWRWLRDRMFSGYKFRRQHPAGTYYLDFFCENARLAVEVDGFDHGHPVKQRRDLERDEYVASLGIKTLRFWNRRLRREPQVVREAIFQALQERSPQRSPHYARAGVVRNGVDKES